MPDKKNWEKWDKTHKTGGGVVYCLGFVGALIYYIQHATTIWLGLLGFLKALVWPAFLVYKLLEFFKLQTFSFIKSFLFDLD